MLSDEVLQRFIAQYQAEFQEIEQEYVERMAEHVRELGHLTASDINRLTEMKRIRLNTEDIERRIAEASNTTGEAMAGLLQQAGKSNVEFARQWFGDTSKAPVTPAVRRIIEAQVRVSKGAFANLSRTHIDNRAYISVIDTGIRAVQSGTMDYRTAIRRAMSKASLNGLRVTYPPKEPGGKPYTRRADSAVRMNILDGVRSLNMDVLRQVGDEYGADGVEVSAHDLCAPDHLDIQGRQFAKKDFYGIGGIADSLKRTFGTCNCKHSVHPIILGVSVPAYSDEQLAEMRRISTEPITIGEGENARTMTRYEWSQEQRRIETAVRQQKDKVIASGGDPEMRRAAQRRIDQLNDRYDEVINGAGLRSSRDRMVVDGWRGNGVGNATPEQLRKGEAWGVPAAGPNDHYTMAGAGVSVGIPDQTPKDFRERLQALEKPNPLEHMGVPINGSYSNDELRAAGQVVQDEVEARLRKHEQQLEALWAERHTALEAMQRAKNAYISSGYSPEARAEWNRLTDQFNAIASKYASMSATTRGTVLRDVINDWRGVGGMTGRNWRTAIDHDGRREAAVNCGIDALNHFPTSWINALQKHKADTGVGFEYVVDYERGRSFYRNWRISINGLDKDYMPVSALHETAHAFENMSSSLRMRAREFYDERTAGEALVTLREATGNILYGPYEVTRVDHFVEPYMGRDYGTGDTELLSMGFQYAFYDPDILRKDPDMEAWLYGILAMM